MAECAYYLDSLEGRLPEEWLRRGGPEALLQAGCARGDPDACYVLGRAMEDERLGVQKDGAGALASYEKACASGVHLACRRVR